MGLRSLELRRPICFSSTILRASTAIPPAIPVHIATTTSWELAESSPPADLGSGEDRDPQRFRVNLSSESHNLPSYQEHFSQAAERMPDLENYFVIFSKMPFPTIPFV
jgi:hypothetical protein